MTTEVKPEERLWIWVLDYMLPLVTVAVLLASCILGSRQKEIWVDEVFTLQVITDRSLPHMMHALANAVDGGMPLYYLLAYGWIYRLWLPMPIISVKRPLALTITRWTGMLPCNRAVQGPPWNISFCAMPKCRDIPATESLIRIRPCAASRVFLCSTIPLWRGFEPEYSAIPILRWITSATLHPTGSCGW